MSNGPLVFFIVLSITCFITVVWGQGYASRLYNPNYAADRNELTQRNKTAGFAAGTTSLLYLHFRKYAGYNYTLNQTMYWHQKALFWPIVDRLALLEVPNSKHSDI